MIVLRALSADVVVADASTGRQLDRMSYPDGYVVDGLSLSPDGQYLSVSLVEAGAGATRHKVEVRDVRKRKKIAEYKDQEGRGVFSPDSRVYISPQGEVRDLTTGDTHTSDFGHGSTTELAFSPDGTRLAVLKSDGWVEVWDGEVRERIARMPGITIQGESHFGSTVEHLTFSEDGSLLATSVGGRAVQLWDVDERVSLGQPLTLTAQHVDAMAFDGEVLRSLSGDKVHTLDLKPEHLADQVCKRVGRELTRKEWQTFVPDAEYRKVC
ncbi:WD40 repeat domain-containing protein [Streptomyces sp. NPDC001787]|uniref:WD40 repeat domain-containing protein n=1 Tax=Streptomyces sp. NPDC001787 TaxID=3154523 RepID=UPI00332980BC